MLLSFGGRVLPSGNSRTLEPLSALRKKKGQASRKAHMSRRNVKGKKKPSGRCEAATEDVGTRRVRKEEEKPECP